jgi:hypothetical protein
VPNDIVSFSRRIEAALGDRAALKRLRRTIRTTRSLTETERAELLDRAQFIPGCIPPALEIADDGSLRPVLSGQGR